MDALTGKSMTYLEMKEQAELFSSSLYKIGARKGDVLTLMVPNCIEIPVIFSGAAKIGLIISPMNPSSKVYGIRTILAKAKPKWILCGGEEINRVLEAIGSEEEEKWKNRIFILAGF